MARIVLHTKKTPEKASGIQSLKIVFASPQDDFCNDAVLVASHALTAEPIAFTATPKKTKNLLIYLAYSKIHKVYK